MGSNGSIMEDADEKFIREVMYIMIAWTIVVILAGIGLVLFRDSFAGIFAVAGSGLFF